MENFEIKAEGAIEVNVQFSDYYVINNQGTLLNMTNCELVLNDTYDNIVWEEISTES